jgi:hypothetical protein
MQERRRSERMDIPLVAVLRRHQPPDRTRAVAAVMSNVSGGGAFLRVAERVTPGERVLVVFRLAQSGRDGARIAARGQVLRADEEDIGVHGIAVRFTSHRFL